MARKPQKSESSSTVLLRIELLNIQPLIWRRVRVPAKWTLRRLHELIQKVFGWEDRHLHDFRLGDLRTGMPELDESEAGLQDDREWTLAEVLRTGVREFSYTYDFGDDWEHRLIVEPEARTETGAQTRADVPRWRKCCATRGRRRTTGVRVVPRGARRSAA